MIISDRKDAQEKLQLMEALLDTMDLWAIHYRAKDEKVKDSYDKIVNFMLDDLNEINKFIDEHPAEKESGIILPDGVVPNVPDKDPNSSISDN